MLLLPETWAFLKKNWRALFGSISELQDNYRKKRMKFVVMTATYDPPGILILLIQLERDHLNNWQALLTALPGLLPGVFRGRKALVWQPPTCSYRALCGFCTAIAVWIASSRGRGQTSMQLAWKTTMDSREKAVMSSFRGLGRPPQPLHNERGYWKQPRDTPQSWDSPDVSHEGDSSWCPSPSSLSKGWQ